MDTEYLALTNHHNYLFMTSQLSIISAIYGYNNYIQLWIIPAGVYLNSVNYWRNPQSGWRHNFYIGYAIHGVIYQHIVAYHLPICPIWYYLFSFLSIISYQASIWFLQKKQYIMTTFLHSLIHLFDNLANIALYYHFNTIFNHPS